MSMICELFLVPEATAKNLNADPTGIHDVLESVGGSEDVVSLEKSWHGLHFALTGTAWEGQPPLNFLASGGTPIGDEDVGYGPARLLDPAGVAALHAALSQLTDEQFERSFDLAGLEREEIYPSIWDEELEELMEEYGHYLQEFKQIAKRGAESGQALIVAIR